MNHLGPDGYHWRVCVEDKPAAGENPDGKKSFTWWDVQDENAPLPLKQATQSQLIKFFSPPKPESSTSDSVTKAAKGAFKGFSKAMSSAVTGQDGMDSGPPVSVVAFKLLDLVKMHDDFEGKNHGRGGHIPSPPQQRAQRHPAASAPAPRTQQQQMRQSAPAATHQQRPQAAQPPRRATQQPQRQQQPPPAKEASLMDFGDSSSQGSRPTLNHMGSSPASFNDNVNPNETRAERLKREYAKKKSSSNRVWDDVDQRWVEAPSAGAGSRASSNASGFSSSNGKKNVGISLDPANAVGKSATVQAAVNKRVNDMRSSQAKALEEIREREEKKKAEEIEEDGVRRKLEPKIKAWSEEYGKKKQLRALLATLHTILWPEANWKPVGIGDIMDNSKCKRCFHKASRVVHPDKTHHLDAEKRFLAKRIFDALCQAKVEFDNGKT